MLIILILWLGICKLLLNVHNFVHCASTFKLYLKYVWVKATQPVYIAMYHIHLPTNYTLHYVNLWLKVIKNVLSPLFWQVEQVLYNSVKRQLSAYSKFSKFSGQLNLKTKLYIMIQFNHKLVCIHNINFLFLQLILFISFKILQRDGSEVSHCWTSCCPL